MRLRPKIITKIIAVAIVYTDEKRYLSHVCVRCVLCSHFCFAFLAESFSFFIDFSSGFLRHFVFVYGPLGRSSYSALVLTHVHSECFFKLLLTSGSQTDTGQQQCERVCCAGL